MDNGGVVNNGGMVGRGSVVDNGGMVSRGSVDNRGVISRGSVDKTGSMVSSTSNRSVSTECWLNLRETLSIVYLRDRGVSSTKCLGLDNASLFTIRSGH